MATPRVAVVVLALTGLLAAAPALSVSAQTQRQIEVFPGRHALAKALAEAMPGDALELHTGRYRDSVTVTTPNIVIELAGDGPVTIDGQCEQVATILVEADAVTLEGRITVTGGRFYAVEFVGALSGILNGFTLKASCNAVFGAFLQRSTVLVMSNRTTGFIGAGVDLLGITDTVRQTLVAANRVSGGERGIIVEDSGGGRIELRDNVLHDNTLSGIHLRNSDQVLIDHDTARNDGTYGIDLDENSDNNTVKRNTAMGNTFDLSNAGTGNCFKDNRYSTSEGDISC